MKSKTDKLTVTNNRGVAMVSVMIIATVCFLVATIVLEITYTSLLSRKVYRTSNDTMYSAEAAVDDMETVLQSIAVYSIKENKTDPSRHFVDVVEETLKKASGATALTDTATVSDYIYNNLDPYYKKMFSKDGTWDEETKSGEREDNKFKVTVINKSNGDENGAAASMALHVDFTFEDEKGYQSKIETDLVVNDITVRKSVSDYPIGSYSMFTGGGMEVVGNDTNGITNGKTAIIRQEGNAYVGTMSDKAPLALSMTGDVMLEFSGEFVEINGDVRVGEDCTLCFSGEKATVNVKGTIYLDDTAFLILGKGVNLLCRDIVIVNGDKNLSVFNAGNSSYMRKNADSYNCLYPLAATDMKQIDDNPSQAIAIHGDCKTGKTNGVILYWEDNKSYVLECVPGDGTCSWKKTADGSAANVTISRDSNYMPEAKTTVWTYDNQVLVTDPELARFVNIPFMFLQSQMPSGAYYHHNNYAEITTRDPIVDVTFDTKGGGAQYKGPSVGGKKTGELSFVDYKTEAGEGVGFPLKNGDTLKLGTKTFNKVWFKSGNTTDGGKDLTLGNNSVIVFAALWPEYTLQTGGGTEIVGITISGSKCLYKTGDGLTVARSILDAKNYSPEGASDAEKAQTIENNTKVLKNMLGDLRYITFIQHDSKEKQKYLKQDSDADLQYNLDHAYQYGMLDGLFAEGMMSFLSEGAGTTSGSVTVSDSSMYDFISVENWTQQ